jgi:hypothetical protein
MEKVMNKLILIVAFVIFLVIIGPIATIWALNTLFPALAIPFTFDTWVAAVILGGVFKTSITKKD